jgi:exodeoxyribonuclease V alpha subunit
MDYNTNILYKAGFFSSLDYYFADTMLKIAGESNEIAKFSAALASKITRDGHICFDIPEKADKSILLSDPSLNKSDAPVDLSGFKFPAKTKWIDALRSSKIVGADSDCPLVLDSDNKLYLARYYDYQKRICLNISQRTQKQLPDINRTALDAELNKYFKIVETENDEKNIGISSQKDIIKKAIINNFLIITGGPGTGKTYITEKIVTIFKNLSDLTTPLKVVNTAPTGKAASKLQDGLTIHRLLKINKANKVLHKKNKTDIAADLVIIDEASMIDISTMTKLLEAIPLTSKVIIIGDKDQLGAVETGSIFADICLSQKLENYIASLEYNFRSNSQKGINNLAKAIRSGDKAGIKDILTCAEPTDSNDVAFLNIKDPAEIRSILKDIIINGYSPWLEEKDAELSYKKLNKFKILCSHRKTFFGTVNLNIITEKLLQDYPIHGIKATFLKSILMITKNDYNKLLFNGDMGMVAEKDGTGKAIFMNGDSALRSFNLSELKDFEKAFAVTVHKSQGSEFDHVLLILPPVNTPLLNKELLYTAITRARQKVTIAGNINVIINAVGSNSTKKSGLTEMLDKNIIET